MIIRNILSEEDKNFIINEWNSSLDKKDDYQAIGTLTIRQSPFLENIHTKIKKILETKTKLKLKEKFTIIREYKKGDVLKKHIDNAAPFAITIVVKQSDNKENPLVFYKKDFTENVLLQEGDGYFFEGMDVPHERKKVKSDYILHIYLGYNNMRMI